jgi:hypothetical protein
MNSLRTALLVTASVAASAAHAQSVHNPTPEETAAFLMDGLDDNAVYNDKGSRVTIKEISKDPLIFETIEKFPAFTSKLRSKVTSIDEERCRYLLVRTSAETGDFIFKQEMDFSRLSNIDFSRPDLEIYFHFGGSCAVKTWLSDTNDQPACNYIFGHPYWENKDRLAKAVRYLQDNFCKPRPF